MKRSVSTWSALRIARLAGELIAAVTACVDGVTPEEAARVVAAAAALAEAVRGELE